MNDIIWKTGLELREMIKSKEVSPVEVVKTHLDRLTQVNSRINAVVNIIEEDALDKAKAAEKAVLDSYDDKDSTTSNGLPPLLGIPVVIKDNVPTKGIKTTYGSKLFKDHIPDKDAILVERLKAAGAIPIGKTNLPEFGLLAITDNVLFGATKNPWDLDKTPGGSSGGSAAAVVEGIAPLATGNDVGGSIRIPASYCGVFGIKPTYGRIPLYPKQPGFEGVFHEGPITRTVKDAAVMLGIMSGHDNRDRSALPGIIPDDYYLKNLDGKIDGYKIAYCDNLGYTKVDPEIKEMTREKAKIFEKLGCTVEKIDLDLPDMLRHLQNMTISDFVSSIDDRLDEWKEVMDPKYEGFFKVAENITGKDISKVYITKDLLWERIRQVFEGFDLLITPTTSVAPFTYEEGKGPIGPSSIDDEKVNRMAWMGFNYPFNFTGQPAASINCGFTKDNLPVGLQIIGKHFDEEIILNAAYAFEYELSK